MCGGRGQTHPKTLDKQGGGGVLYLSYFNFNFVLFSSVFSSSKPKAQVSLSNCPVARPSIRSSVCPSTFHIFDLISRTTWPNLNKLSIKHSYVKEILNYENNGRN